MKRITYLLAALFLLSTTNVFAHCSVCPLSKKGSMSTEDKVAAKVKKLTESLGLTAEQIPQVEAILNTKYSKKKTIMETKQKEMEAVRTDYSTQIDAILTEEQKVKHEAMKAEWKKGGMKGSGQDHKGSDHEHKGSFHQEKGSAGEVK